MERGLPASAALGHSSQGIRGFLSWTGLWRLPGGILDGPYLPSFIPPSSPPVKCEPRPLETNLQPEQGAPGTPMNCRGRSTSQSPGAGAQGLGQGRPFLLSPGTWRLPSGPSPRGSSARCGSSTFAPLLSNLGLAWQFRQRQPVAVDFSLRGHHEPKAPELPQGTTGCWFRRFPCPCRPKPEVFPTQTGVESQAHDPKGLTALWLGLRGLR